MNKSQKKDDGLIFIKHELENIKQSLQQLLYNQSVLLDRNNEFKKGSVKLIVEEVVNAFKFNHRKDNKLITFEDLLLENAKRQVKRLK